MIAIKRETRKRVKEALAPIVSRIAEKRNNGDMTHEAMMKSVENFLLPYAAYVANKIPDPQFRVDYKVEEDADWWKKLLIHKCHGYLILPNSMELK